MKKCPACKSIYTDDSLAYCLTDGTKLLGAGSAGETVRMQVMPTAPSLPDSSTVEQPDARNTVDSVEDLPYRNRRSVSRIWIYATVALSSILVGALAFFLVLGGLRKTEERSGSANEQQNSTLPVQINLPVANIPSVNNPPPISPEKPVSSSPRFPGSSPSATYRVTGVFPNDVLHIRPAPGNLKISVAQIPPGTTGINVTGAAVRVGRTFWLPIQYNGASGWVNKKFLAPE